MQRIAGQSQPAAGAGGVADVNEAIEELTSVWIEVMLQVWIETCPPPDSCPS